MGGAARGRLAGRQPVAEPGHLPGWLERGRTLDALGGYGLADFQVAVGAEHVKMPGVRISPRALETLGVHPAMGRLLAEHDVDGGAPPVVVVSERLWRERFSASRDVLGRTLFIDGTAHTIVGVRPPAFGFPEPGVRFWVPYAIPRSSAAPMGPVVFTTLGRLKPGVTIRQVEAEGTAAAMAAPSHRLTGFFFGSKGSPVVHARPLADDMTLAVRPALSVMATAVTLVLLVACVNAASLLLSQGAARQREFAIRTAVGGSRGRLLRQVLTEGAVVAAAGSTLGFLVGVALLHLGRLLAPATLPRLGEVAIDGRIVALWAVTTLAVMAAIGLVPAWRAARVDPSDALRGPDRGSGTGFRSARTRRLRDGLLVVEAALAIVLIVGASLLLRSFVRLTAVDNGYVSAGVLIAAVEMPAGAGDARTDRFIDQVLQRVRRLPGVSSAGASGMVPLMKQTAVSGFVVPEALAGGKATQGRARVYSVTPGYAEAIGLRSSQGRFFVDADARAATLNTIVNEEFVRQHLAVGQAAGVVVAGLVGGDRPIAAEIVGVVDNVLKDGNDKQPQPELYFIHGSHGQRISGRINLVIRTAGDPSRLGVDVRALVRDADGSVVIDRIEPLATTVAASLDAPRFAAAVMAAFAAVGVVLAGIGLYGAVAYSVSQRERELGVRSALGAQRGDLVRLVLGEGVLVILPGIALGMLGAIAFARLMQGLLFGVTPLDTVAFAIAPLLLTVTALLACLAPALRAGTTDPVVTLRK